MSARMYVSEAGAQAPEAVWALPEGAARHVQVLRMQPGELVRVFDGRGGEWLAEVVEMQRKAVYVRLREAAANDRELPIAVTLAIGMPANDRMDFLVEKAAELGVRRIQPLMCARSVLRLDGERAARKVAHWQGVAVAACEQSGRAWVPEVAPVRTLAAFLQDSEKDDGERRGVLSPRATASLLTWAGSGQTAPSAGASARWCLLSGPEGGLTDEEEALAQQRGWAPVSLGKRILRADTAPLAALTLLGALHER